MATPVKVKKWGSSMAGLIPKHFAETRDIEVGTVLDIEPVKIVQGRRPRYKLSELVAGFKPRHRQGEWNLGGPVGREVCRMARRTCIPERGDPGEVDSVILSDALRRLDYRERSMTFVARCPREILDEVTLPSLSLIDPEAEF